MANFDQIDSNYRFPVTPGNIHSRAFLKIVVPLYRTDALYNRVYLYVLMYSVQVSLSGYSKVQIIYENGMVASY